MLIQLSCCPEIVLFGCKINLPSQILPDLMKQAGKLDLFEGVAGPVGLEKLEHILHYLQLIMQLSRDSRLKQLENAVERYVLPPLVHGEWDNSGYACLSEDIGAKGNLFNLLSGGKLLCYILLDVGQLAGYASLFQGGKKLFDPGIDPWISGHQLTKFMQRGKL